MSQKLLNTRIGLKYDTYANWTRTGTWNEGVFTPGDVSTTYWGSLLSNAPYDGFIPLKGEVCFFEIPAQTGAVSQEPAILFKVGDGVKNLHSLPWGSAIAADVYAWAKNQSLLGGTQDPQTGNWTWSQDSAYAQEQDEVAAFVNELVAADTQVRIITTGTPAQLQLQISTDGGTTWTNSGTPISGGDGIKIDANNTISIDIDSDYLTISSQDGLDVVPTTVTYTAASGNDPANLTATGTGLVTNLAISEIKSYIDAKAGEEDVTMTSGDGSGDILKVYTFSQGGHTIGTINIPKDYLVKSAELKTVTQANVPYQGAEVGDKYIDFVINTKDTTSGSGTESHVYLPVKDLVDVYTGDWTLGDGQGDQNGYIKIEINSNNEVSAHYYVQDLSTASGSHDGLVTAYDAKTYIDNAISSATPNIESGDGIDITTSGSTKTISIELDETTQTSGLTQNSGLSVSSLGLRIDDTLLWVLQCGGAEIDPNNP